VVEDREQLIAAIVSRKLQYLAIEPSARRVVFQSADAAFVHGVGHINARSGDKTLDFRARYLAVYGLQDGAWRLRAWQSLRLP
jgi:ketosteroid isomerase-like protein